jgi:hypothetical protein
MKILIVDGSIIIIGLGIPLVAYLVSSLRKQRIETLTHCVTDKVKSDIDALIQISTIKQWSIGQTGIKTDTGDIDKDL